MVRPWNRKRRPRADEDPDATRGRGTAARSDVADDLEERLEAVTSVTSAFKRPPSAEELRAKLTGRRPPAPAEEPTEEPTDGPTFASQYTTESLFIGSTDDVPRASAADDITDDGGAAYYDPEDAWAVLGVQPGSEWATIVRAHRRIALRHHPDRLNHRSPDERARSEELMREANIAYTTLKRLRSR